MSEESRKMAKLAVEALEDKKAEDIKVIDISKVSVIADYFIIAGGNNSSQIQALCDNVEEKLGRAGFPARQTEGYAVSYTHLDVYKRQVWSICGLPGMPCCWQRLLMKEILSPPADLSAVMANGWRNTHTIPVRSHYAGNM